MDSILNSSDESLIQPIDEEQSLESTIKPDLSSDNFMSKEDNPFASAKNEMKRKARFDHDEKENKATSPTAVLFRSHDLNLMSRGIA
jgi:hypothetical protein